MARHLLFSLFLFSTILNAQSDSLPQPPPLSLSKRITSARQNLITSFVANDPAEAAIWQDSLMRLENNTHVALVWDERWLLYFWEESYGNLFDEVSRFDAAERQRLADKIPPPRDSLFAWLDYTLYETRFQQYEKIGRGFLSEEEKQFALIELDYLLRLNQADIASGEWNKRLDAFLQVHPDSRFKTYIQDNLYGPASSAKKIQTDRGFGFDLLFSSGRWRDELERNIRSPYGFDVGLTYWFRRWNFGLRSNFSWQKLERSIFVDGYEWPKGDQSSLIVPELEVGYDIFNNRQFKVYPSVLAGISIIKPPSASEDQDPPPDYYSEFVFANGFLGVAFTTDIKLKAFNSQDEESGDVSYIGARLRLGYNWLNWDNKTPSMRGDLFFFAIGVNLFGHSIE